MIVDSSIMIASVERRDAVAISALKAIRGRSTRSMIVVGELAFGVERARLDAGVAPARIVTIREATLAAYIATSDLAEERRDDDVAGKFGVISALAMTAGLRIGPNDRWILAEALARGQQVLTADHRMDELGAAVDHRLARRTPTVVVPHA